jgi:hypothetical protein
MRLIPFLGLLSIACGDTSSTPIDAADATIDAAQTTIDAPGTTIDAPGTTIDAAGTTVDAAAADAGPVCAVPAETDLPPESMTGTITCNNGVGGPAIVCPSLDPESTDVGSIRIPTQLNADGLPDVLSIQLYRGYGEYAATIGPGSYSLVTAENSNYATCGSCFLIYGDYTGPGTGTGYFQTGGAFTISSITPAAPGATTATLSGSVAGLTLTHVTISSSAVSTPVGDGCDVVVPDFSFTATLTDINVP